MSDFIISLFEQETLDCSFKKEMKLFYLTGPLGYIFKSAAWFILTVTETGIQGEKYIRQEGLWRAYENRINISLLCIFHFIFFWSRNHGNEAIFCKSYYCILM